MGSPKNKVISSNIEIYKDEIEGLNNKLENIKNVINEHVSSVSKSLDEISNLVNMKKFLFCLLLSSIFLISCNNKPTHEEMCTAVLCGEQERLPLIKQNTLSLQYYDNVMIDSIVPIGYNSAILHVSLYHNNDNESNKKTRLIEVSDIKYNEDDETVSWITHWGY